MRENILRAATFIRTRRPRVPFHSALKLLENLRKRRKERVKRFPSPYLTSAPSALPCLFTDSRKGKRRRMERIQGTYERESRKEGTRGTPFTAQWAPLKPKVMKVSGCLSRSPSLVARFATWPPLRHAQDISLYRVCVANDRTFASFPFQRDIYEDSSSNFFTVVKII